MALDKWDFIEIAIALEVGAHVGKEKLREFYAEAGRRGINLLRPGTYPVDPAPPVQETLRSRIGAGARAVGGRLLRRSPYIAGGAVAMDMLNNRDIYAGQLLDQWESMEGKATGGRGTTVQKIRKKAGKFNKAVSAGMKALKRSKSYGKPGTLNNPKNAFKAVTKVASKLNKGKKVSGSGVVGIIKKGIGRIL